MCISANAKDIILECNGTLEVEGMNLPKSLIRSSIGKKEVAFQQYLVSDNSITVVGGAPGIEDDKIQLCSKSNNAYIYAWDCAVKEPRRMAVEWTTEDWTLAEKDYLDKHEPKNLAKDSQFHKKWLPTPGSYLGAKIIYLDRVNLSIVDDRYDLSWNPIFKSDKVEFQNYVWVYHFEAQCKIVKAKL